MSLHIVYRAKKLSEIVGNKATITSLSTVLQRKDPPAAFLFTGPAGTGKTTLARIVKTELGCSDSDFVELNAADDRGIDAIRGIRDQMKFAPLSSKRKVFLLDEAHMLTKPSQEAILKILEEPPKNIHICICTTNPEALKDTFKRRCHEYHLRPLQDEDQKVLIKRILAAEGIDKKRFSSEVIDKLLKTASGSAGLMLKLLDMILETTDKNEMLTVLDSISYSETSGEIIELCRILFDPNITNEDHRFTKLAALIKDLTVDPESARRVIISYAEKILLSRKSSRAAMIIYNFKDNLFDSGRPGLTLGIYGCCDSEEK